MALDTPGLWPLLDNIRQWYYTDTIAALARGLQGQRTVVDMLLQDANRCR